MREGGGRERGGEGARKEEGEGGEFEFVLTNKDGDDTKTDCGSEVTHLKYKRSIYSINHGLLRSPVIIPFCQCCNPN